MHMIRVRHRDPQAISLPYLRIDCTVQPGIAAAVRTAKGFLCGWFLPPKSAAKHQPTWNAIT